MPEQQIILITGAAGSIGSELVRQLCEKNRVIMLDNNESAFFDLYEELRQKGFDVCGKVGDVRDKDIFPELALEFGVPLIIFHCAALKHVTPSCWNAREYVDVNIRGTLNVVQFARANGVKLINISTDKAVNANSIMGSTKRVAEISVRDAGQISVRFGNVMGSRGSVLEIWQRQLNRGEALTVTDPTMTRYMMTIPDACQLLIRAVEIGNPGDILIMKMGEKTNILKLANDILRKSGNGVGIQMIGARPGETLTEILMTDEEQKRVKELENFYVIPA